MSLNTSICTHLSAAISNASNMPFKVKSALSVHGGDINRCYALHDGNLTYFAKVNDASLIDMFEQEALSLTTLKTASSIILPSPITYGCFKDVSYLILTFHPMQNHGNDYELGQNLAKLHAHSHSRFGWDKNNYIGSTLQKNGFTGNWAVFWQEHRIQPQFELAFQNGFHRQLAPLAKQFIARIPDILADHNPSPSLLHGDLWAGNAGFIETGAPILYDPASYYGDRETDLAMTELFGGFRQDFYRGYEAQWPLAKNYQSRKPLYNLYHMLNHLNLFGSGYLSTCLAIITRLLKP